MDGTNYFSNCGDMCRGRHETWKTLLLSVDSAVDDKEAVTIMTSSIWLILSTETDTRSNTSILFIIKKATPE